jgi:hypothetical protein
MLVGVSISISTPFPIPKGSNSERVQFRKFACSRKNIEAAAIIEQTSTADKGNAGAFDARFGENRDIFARSLSESR